MRKNIGTTFYGKALKGAAIGAVGLGLQKASKFRNRELDEDLTENNKNQNNNSQSRQAENRENDQDNSNSNDQEISQNISEGSESSSENTNMSNANARLSSAVSGTTHAEGGLNEDEIRDARINRMSHEELEKNVLRARKAFYENQTEETKYNYIKAYNDLHRKEQLDAITTSDVISGHIDRLFDMDNYYDVRINKNGQKEYVRKNSKKDKKEYAKKKGAIYGTKHYDYQQGKLVSDKNAAIDQLRISNLLGFTKKDSKVFKENVTDPLKKGFLGTAAMFIGLSTFVIHPKLGMGLIAYGVPNKYGSFHKLYGKSRRINGYRNDKGQKFNYKGFSAPTMKKMKDVAIMKFEEEQDKQVVDNIKVNHPNLFFGLKAGTVTAATFAGQTVGFMGTAIPVVGPAMPLVGSIVGLAGSTKVLGSFEKHRYTRKKRMYSADENGMPRVERNDDYEEYATRKVSESEYNINKHHYEQLKEQQKEFEEEALKLIGNEVSHNIEIENQIFMQDLAISTLSQMGYEVDADTGKINKIIEENENEDITEDELVEKINGKRITDADNRKANEALDFILYKMANNEKLDINSEKKIDRVINELTVELTFIGIITPEQSAEDVWRHGKKGLVDAIKRKTVKVNKRIEAEKIIFEQLNTVEISAIKEAVDEVLEEEIEKQIGNTNQESISKETSNLYPEHILEQELDSIEEPDYTTNPFEEYINEAEPINYNNSRSNGLSNSSRLRSKDPYGRASNIEKKDKKLSEYISKTTPKRVIRPKNLYRTIATSNIKTNAILTKAYKKIDKKTVLEKVTKKIGVKQQLSNLRSTYSNGSSNVDSSPSANITGSSSSNGIENPSLIFGNTGTNNSALNLDGNNQTPSVVDITQEKMGAYLEAISNYLELKKEEIGSVEPKKKEISPEEEREVQEKLSQELRRKSQKFNDALSVFLEEPEKGVIDLYNDEDFKGSDPQAVLEYLLMAQKLNDEGKEISVRGNVEYNRKLSNSYQAQANFNKIKLQIKKKELEGNLPPDYDKVVDYSSLSTEEKIRIDEIEELKKQLPSNKKKAERSEKEAKREGPIVNINKIMKKMG